MEIIILTMVRLGLENNLYKNNLYFPRICLRTPQKNNKRENPRRFPFLGKTNHIRISCVITWI